MQVFAEWLNEELNNRGWSRSEAARRGGFSPSMMDQVIGGFANPGLTFCRGIARAFNMPLVVVLEKAGIVPPSTAAAGEGELLIYFREMTEDDRRRVLRIARGLWEDSRPR